MAEQLSFDEAFGKIRANFNAAMKINVSVEVNRFDTGPYHVRTLATVILMLIHNAERPKKGGKKYEPNIYTLANYDLNKRLIDHDMFIPYINYLMGSSQDKYVRADYDASFVRLIEVVKRHRVTVVKVE